MVLNYQTRARTRSGGSEIPERATGYDSVPRVSLYIDSFFSGFVAQEGLVTARDPFPSY